MDGSDFHFHSSPYLLFLSFPGRLLDDAETCREAKAKYDPSTQNGILTVVMWKEEEGIWKDLDLLGNLVNRPGTPGAPSKEKIQVLSSTENETTLNDDEDEDEDEKVPKFSEDVQSCLRPHYGFLNKDHSVFTAYAREGLSHDMLEIPNPDETSSDERRDLRLDAEHSKFDPDRYLSDLFLSADENDEYSDMIFVQAMRMTPHWESTSVDELAAEMNKLDTNDNDSSKSSKKESSFFNEDENVRLMNNKSHLPDVSKISEQQTESLFLSLLDVLYAYSYDHRTTFGDETCESSWTVVVLSPTLSWLESYTPPYDNIAGVLRWSIRRAMIYPYLRNFDFVSKQLVKDVLNILSGGVRVVLRCLLQVQQILDTSEFHYLFNKLYISPYISWIQMVGDDALADFALKVKKSLSDKRVFAKSSFGLDLEVLENNAFEGDESDDSDSDESSTTSSSSDDDDVIATEKTVTILDSEIGNSILNISKSRADQMENEDTEIVSPIGNNASSTKKVLISEI